MSKRIPSLPPATPSIQKGSTLKDLLDIDAVACLAANLKLAHPNFDARGFRQACMTGLAPLALMQRAQHLGATMRVFLPESYEAAIDVISRSLTPPHEQTEGLGLAGFFYLPHSCFVGAYGLDPAHNAGRDPFEASMDIQYQLTRRFTAEFSIRPFLIQQPERTLERLGAWARDPDPYVRRLCSEGTRPRLPWGCRIPAFVRDPSPTLPILETLRDDPELYVRRSVANHLGDVAKDNPQFMFAICRSWLDGASAERKWLIRHALRHPAKKGNREALQLRNMARK